MMAQIPGGIPPPLDDDVDDVAWALQTAQVQWKRAAYADAIVWLRRAIDAAMEAGQAQRANDLSAAAWRLTELMLSQAEPDTIAEAPRPPSVRSADALVSGRRPSDGLGDDVDELLGAASEDVPISVAPQRARYDSADTERKLTPAPTPSTAPLEYTEPDDRISIAPISSIPVDDEPTEAIEVGPPAAAFPTPVPAAFPSPRPPDGPRAPQPVGLPAESAAARSPLGRAQPHAQPLDTTDNTPIEVPRPTLPGAPRPSVGPSASRPGAASPSDARRPHASSAARSQVARGDSARAQQSSAARPASTKSGGPARTSSQVMRPPPPMPQVPAPRTPESDPPLPRFPSEEEETIEAPMQMLASELAPLDERAGAPPEPALDDVMKTEAPPLGEASPSVLPPDLPTHAPPAGSPLPALSLVDVRALQDLPEEAQAELAANARLQTLARGGELGPCAVAIVLDGWVTVTPAIAQVGCARVAAGDLVCTLGSLAESVELSVVAGQDDTLVAVWDADLIERVTADCPWVADDLRAIGDRFQALVGVTMGAMGDRLDDALRAMVTERCEVRTLGPGELLVEGGKPVPGMHIVGVGRIEIVRGEGEQAEVSDELGPGDFLFAAEVLAAGPAPAAARAGKTGALVLFAPRKVAHELLVSVPPLLEIFAS